MMLKPQDVLVVLKLAAMGRRDWTYASLAVELGLSPSQLHSAFKRAIEAQLAIASEGVIAPQFRNLEEFLVHGIRYVFVPERGELTRGVPTAHAAPPLKAHFKASGEPPPVWPDPEGKVRGMSFSPLYKIAPQAARRDEKLYELLALVDAIRGGRARERSLAIQMLSKRLADHG